MSRPNQHLPTVKCHRLPQTKGRLSSSLISTRNLFGVSATTCRTLGLASICLAAAVALNVNTSGQSLPKEIRGYKVDNTRIRVLISTDPIKSADNTDAVIRLGTPEFADISLTGLDLDVDAEIKTTKRSGSVDFVTFRDFKVNGVPVAIEEYAAVFAFRPNQISRLPKPVRVHIGASSIARTAFRELIGSKKEWSVEGTVLVFGKFHAFGMNFKRVVPVKIAFVIPNPVISRFK